MSEKEKKDGLTRRIFLRNTSLATIASFFLGSKSAKAVSRGNSRSNKGCEFYNAHKDNDKYVTEYFGGKLFCSQGNCKNAGERLGRIEGDGPDFYICSIGDALRGQ